MGAAQEAVSGDPDRVRWSAVGRRGEGTLAAPSNVRQYVQAAPTSIFPETDQF